MNYKTGYTYSKETGEYIGEEIVYQEKATGTYPCADNVTFVKPPAAGEHQKQVWNGQKWSVVADYRGEIVYSEEGKPVGFVGDLGIDGSSVILKAPPEVDPAYTLSWDGEDWKLTLKEGYVKEGGVAREMTTEEKIIAGLLPLPDDMKIEDGHVVSKTRDDLYDEGKITVEEYNELVDQERQARYQAETDKMGLMFLRGECTLEEWVAAMDKIRAETPKK